jgi:ElaB/YqjD/DUF883 family membrane-anchored ribosome-binding protein
MEGKRQGKTVDEELNLAANDVHDTVDSAAGKAHASVDKAADKLDAAAEKIDAAADDLNARINEIQDRLKADGERLFASAREFGDIISKQTRQHPLTACGVAFVAGIAVARLLRR